MHKMGIVDPRSS